MSEHETHAATVIQTHFRGYLARKQYTMKLLAIFEEEEEKRREKELLHMLEGEILLEKYRLRNTIAENITLNHNEERLMNMMATRIQQAWKKYRENRIVHNQERIQTHPQPVGRQVYNTDLGESNALLNEEQVKTGAHAMCTTSCSMLEKSHAHHHFDSGPLSASNRDGTWLTSRPKSTITQDSMPTKVSADPQYHKALMSSRPMSQNSEGSETAVHTESGKGKLKSTSTDVVQKSGLAQFPTSVKPLDKNVHMLNKEGVTSPGDRYRLCYTIELSDSSTDEDMNWLARPEEENFPVIPCMLGGNVAMEDFSDDRHLELEDYVCDDDPIPQYMIETSVGNHGRVSSNKWRQLDHSTSPLYAMTLQQLRQLFLSLEKQLSDHSKSLIELLEERDQLKNENELLKTNIAHLARRAQNLYTAS